MPDSSARVLDICTVDSGGTLAGTIVVPSSLRATRVPLSAPLTSLLSCPAVMLWPGRHPIYLLSSVRMGSSQFIFVLIAAHHLRSGVARGLLVDRSIRMVVPTIVPPGLQVWPLTFL